jgi:hypothetical protein
MLDIHLKKANQKCNRATSALSWSAGGKDVRCSLKKVSQEYRETTSALPWSAEGQVCIAEENGVELTGKKAESECYRKNKYH